MANIDTSLSTTPSLPDYDGHSSKKFALQNEEMEVKPVRVNCDAKCKQLTYHMQAMFLLLVYVPLLVLPWVLTCVIAKRPLSATSYYNSHGFQESDINYRYTSLLTIDVLNSIGSLVTIPI